MMGGNAFDGTRRILKSEIYSTIEWLEPRLNLFEKGYLKSHLLGSSGKKDDSGDVDLNINGNDYDFYHLENVLGQILGRNNVKPNQSVEQIYTKIPINGDPNNGFAQFDFMVGDEKWQEFSYFSSGIEKGLYRTEFIKAWVAFRSDWILFENNEMVARVGPTFFHDNGLVWRYRHRPLKKNGSGRIKQIVELNKDEFLKLYTEAKMASHDYIIDPYLVHLFLTRGRDESMKNCYDTLNQCINTFNKIESPESFEIVKKIYYERLDNLKVEHPNLI